MQNPARNPFGLKRGFTPVILVVIVVIVGLVVVGVATGALKGSFKVSKTEKTPQQDQNTASQNKVQEPSPSPIIEANLAEETYTNSQKGFSIICGRRKINN